MICYFFLNSFFSFFTSVVTKPHVSKPHVGSGGAFGGPGGGLGGPGGGCPGSSKTVSYTHLTLPTNREV